MRSVQVARVPWTRHCGYFRYPEDEVRPRLHEVLGLMLMARPLNESRDVALDGLSEQRIKIDTVE